MKNIKIVVCVPCLHVVLSGLWIAKDLGHLHNINHPDTMQAIGTGFCERS